MINQWDGVEFDECPPAATLCYHNGTQVYESLGFEKVVFHRYTHTFALAQVPEDPGGLKKFFRTYAAFGLCTCFYFQDNWAFDFIMLGVLAIGLRLLGLFALLAKTYRKSK